MNQRRIAQTGLTVAMLFCLSACGGGGEQAFVEAVQVNELNVTEIQIVVPNTVTELNGLESYKASGVVGGDSSNLIDVTSRVRWSTSNSSVASINQAGFLTGRSVGMVDVFARWADLEASAELVVSDALLDSIAIVGMPTSMPVCAYGNKASGEYTLTADGFYVGETVARDISDKVTWASDDDNVATIDLDGVLAAYGDGSVAISASKNRGDGGGLVSTSLNLVVDDTLDSITLTPDSATLTVGSSRQFVATGLYDDASTRDITLTSTWTSSNAGVLAVSDSVGEKGLATGATAGTANIEAICNLSTPVAMASAEVTVNARVVVNDIQINDGTARLTFDIGDSPVDLVAKLLKSDNSIGDTVTELDDTSWRVSDTIEGTAASVSNSGTTKGRVSFSAIGITQIEVRYDDGTLGPFTDTIEIVVE